MLWEAYLHNLGQDGLVKVVIQRGLREVLLILHIFILTLKPQPHHTALQKFFFIFLKRHTSTSVNHSQTTPTHYFND